MTFDTFDETIPGTQNAYEVALQYARNGAAGDKNWLVLAGGYGSGKTHLAAAIANLALHEKHMNPIFAVVPDLLDYLRTTFRPDADASYDDRVSAFRSADLLILDDLGTENATPWAREKLFQIINHRYNESLPLVVTTNHLDLVDERIRSRLVDWQLSHHILIEAPDFRDKHPSSYRRRVATGRRGRLA
jgi:DNA replication protein DnaC